MYKSEYNLYLIVLNLTIFLPTLDFLLFILLIVYSPKLSICAWSKPIFQHKALILSETNDDIPQENHNLPFFYTNQSTFFNHRN